MTEEKTQANPPMRKDQKEEQQKETKKIITSFLRPLAKENRTRVNVMTEGENRAGTSDEGARRRRETKEKNGKTMVN